MLQARQRPRRRLTIRFDRAEQHLPALRARVCAAVQPTRVTGAHLCMGDPELLRMRSFGETFRESYPRIN